MAAVRGFMRHFFQCSDCSKHFASMAAEPEALAVSTPADALLWSWRAHNQVSMPCERSTRAANAYLASMRSS